MRIIIPFPKDIIVIGGAPLKQISKILDHVICLDRELLCTLSRFGSPGECFDTGIYNNARCIRLPYMYKIDSDNGKTLCSKLFPIFIVPEAYKSDPRDFVRMQLDLNNLLHHSNVTNHTNNIVYAIVDKGCSIDNNSFMESRAKLMYAKKNFPLDQLINQYIRSIDNDYSSNLEDDNIVTFTRIVVWNMVKTSIEKHYSERVSLQFQNITFIKMDHNNVQIKKLTFGKLGNFQCLTRQHKGDRDNVHVFLEYKVDGNRIFATLWSRCFTTKCNSNSKQVHLSVALEPIKCY